MRDTHGGNLYAAARERGCHPSDLLDFSASINPLGPSRAVQRIVRKGLWALRHYPDPESHDLVATLSRRSGLSANCYLTGNGSAELLYLLPMALGIKQALILGPTFSEYERAVASAGGTSTYLMADKGEDYRPPLQQVLQQVTQPRARLDAVVICNPNNPTGQAIAPQELRSVLDVAAERNVLVILDEAFIEYLPDATLINEIPTRRNVVILRSFTKFYGMPGLRIGYVVGHPELVERVRSRQPPWSVNALAQAAALAALKDSWHRRKSLALVTDERARFTRALSDIDGIHVYPSSANFLLIDLPVHLVAADVVRQLRDAGLLLRDCSTIPGLTPQSVRVSVRTPQENNRLIRAVESLFRR